MRFLRLRNQISNALSVSEKCKLRKKYGFEDEISIYLNQKEELGHIFLRMYMIARENWEGKVNEWNPWCDFLFRNHTCMFGPG